MVNSAPSSALTRPVYSATSRSVIPTPAWDMTPAPSALTFNRRTDPLR